MTAIYEDHGFLPPTFRLVTDRIIRTIGSEDFDRRYPRLATWLSAPERLTEPAPQPADLFLEIRNEIPKVPDAVDDFLMQGLRLDLQQLSPLEETFGYKNPESRDGLEIRAAIGGAMKLPPVLADYLCHLSHRHRFLYVATPKAACTTLKNQLQQVEMGGRLAFRYYGEEHHPVVSPLLAPLDQPALFFDALKDEDWFRFTFVREPYGRVLSCYIDKIFNGVAERNRLLPLLGLDPEQGPPPFLVFLQRIAAQPEEARDVHWAAQSWLTQPDVVKYHFIGRLESFEADFRTVAERVGFEPQLSAPQHSTHAPSRLSEFYGPEEIELARSIYRDDFIRFGYDPGLL